LDPAENDYFFIIKDDSSDRRAYISVTGDGLFGNKTNQYDFDCEDTYQAQISCFVTWRKVATARNPILI
jgi:hypothetical protein